MTPAKKKDVYVFTVERYRDVHLTLLHLCPSPRGVSILRGVGGVAVDERAMSFH